MSDKASSEADTFYDGLFDAFIRGGTIYAFFHITFYLIDKTIQHNAEIKELREKKNHESTQDS